MSGDEMRSRWVGEVRDSVHLSTEGSPLQRNDADSTIESPVFDVGNYVDYFSSTNVLEVPCKIIYIPWSFRLDPA